MPPPNETPAVSDPGSGSHAELVKLVNQACTGNPGALQELREFLQSSPAAAMTLGGDLSFEATSVLIKRFAGKDIRAREAIFQQMNNLRLELAGDKLFPSGLERLLIEDVVGTWLHLHRLQVLYAEQREPTFRTNAFFQSEITAAHKRYHIALRTLMDARRRPLPPIQINIGDKQVNIAQNVMPPPPQPPAAPSLATLSPSPAPLG